MVSEADRQKIKKLFAQVNELWAEEKWPGVIALMDKAIRLNPADVGAWYNRGAAKFHLEQYEAAISDFDEAIILMPSRHITYSSMALNVRGLAKARLGQYEDAIRDYNEAIRLDPENAFAWNNRGIAKARLGQYEDAIRDYDEAINLKDDEVSPGPALPI